MKSSTNAVMIACLVIMASVAANGQVPSYIPKNGLISYLPFNGTFSDKAPTPQTFINSNVTFDTTVNAYGSKEIAARFAGTVVETPHLLAQDATSFMVPTYSLFVRLKLKALRPAGSDKMYQGIVCLGAKNWTWGPAYNLGLAGADNTIIEMGQWVDDPVGRGLVSTPAGTAAINEWVNVLATYDGTQLHLYVNGVLIGSVPAAIGYENHDRFIIGANADNPDGAIMAGFDGLIDDFAFWNRALDSNEVKQLFKRTPSPCEIPADSILGYRSVETHEVVTYALRNNPNMTYQWTATGGYLLGETNKHFCDVIWGYDNAGSVCCIVSDSTCSDTICVTTSIQPKRVVSVPGDGRDVPSMTVRPNPASETIEIVTAPSTGAVGFELVTATGNVVYQASGAAARMDVSDIPVGVYHIVQRNAYGEMIGMQRVVIVR